MSVRAAGSASHTPVIIRKSRVCPPHTRQFFFLEREAERSDAVWSGPGGGFGVYVSRRAPMQPSHARVSVTGLANARCAQRHTHAPLFRGVIFFSLSALYSC